MRSALFILIACLGLLTAGARPAAARDDQHTRDEARVHYDRGLAHYNLGEFEGAIDEFKEAYALSHAPRLLFNLAQAQRLAKKYDQALYSYQTYLRLQPDAQNRTDVEQWIAEMNRQLAEPTAPTAPTASAPAPKVVPSPAPKIVPPAPKVAPRPAPIANRSRARREKIAGLCVGVGGLALLGAGAGLQAHAAATSGQLGSFSGSWSPAEQSIYSDGQRSQAAAIALFAVGGAATVAGAILTGLGFRATRNFAVAPVSGGAMATLATPF